MKETFMAQWVSHCLERHEHQVLDNMSGVETEMVEARKADMYLPS